jgi:predicted ArsR family transcriptional regulator
MIKKKPLFDSKKRVIIQALNKSRIGLTPYELSKNTGVSWVTVKKHIKDLEKKNIVKCHKLPQTNKRLCKLNFDLIYGKTTKKK